MRSTSVLAPWGIILATVMLAACTTDEPEASFGMSFHHMFDGGIQFKENGKPIKCEANMKWGCCKMGFVAFCKGGYVYIGGCSSKPKCGWNASLNHYACGTSGAQDPSGKHLQDCDKLEDDGGGPAPPDSYIQVCGKLPPQGCCDGFMLARCDSGQSVHEDCSQKSLQCGWNGTKKRYECGSSSKADPSGKYPISCKGYMPDGGMSGKDGAPPPGGRRLQRRHRPRPPEMRQAAGPGLLWGRHAGLLPERLQADPGLQEQRQVRLERRQEQVHLWHQRNPGPRRQVPHLLQELHGTTQERRGRLDLPRRDHLQ